jgi:gas vesicle protein
MKRMELLILSVLIGGLIGLVLVALFAPASGEEFRKRLKISYRETLAEAQQASLARRAELEAELERMQHRA